MAFQKKFRAGEKLAAKLGRLSSYSHLGALIIPHNLKTKKIK